MPYSLVLHCFSPNGPLSQTDIQGQKGMALFIDDLIQQQDAALATRLHDARRAKPFTTAIMVPAGAGKASRIKTVEGAKHVDQGLHEPTEVKIRVTLLDDGLYPLIADYFLRTIGKVPLLHLGRAPLLVSKITATFESGEPWSGCARFEDILDRASGAGTSWTLHFATPTAFRADEADLPLPIPRFCFQSWLSSWDEHSPRPFFPDKAAQREFLTNVVERRVSVEHQIRMSDQTFYFDGHQVRDRGFVGTCRFWVRPRGISQHDRAILAALAAYSFYAGTGRKTTMGMGMTRLLGLERDYPPLASAER